MNAKHEKKKKENEKCPTTAALAQLPFNIVTLFSLFMRLSLRTSLLENDWFT